MNSFFGASVFWQCTVLARSDFCGFLCGNLQNVLPELYTVREGGEGEDFWGPNCSTDGGTEFCFWGLFCIRGDMEFVFLAGRGDFCILIREYFEDWCRCIYTQQCITTPRAYTKKRWRHLWRQRMDTVPHKFSNLLKYIVYVYEIDVPVMSSEKR